MLFKILEVSKAQNDLLLKNNLIKSSFTEHILFGWCNLLWMCSDECDYSLKDIWCSQHSEEQVVSSRQTWFCFFEISTATVKKTVISETEKRHDHISQNSMEILKWWVLNLTLKNKLFHMCYFPPRQASAS